MSSNETKKKKDVGNICWEGGVMEIQFVYKGCIKNKFSEIPVLDDSEHYTYIHIYIVFEICKRNNETSDRK